MSEGEDLPKLFLTLSDEEYEKLPGLSEEDIEEMWAKIRRAWCEAKEAPRPRPRIIGRFYR